MYKGKIELVGLESKVKTPSAQLIQNPLILPYVEPDNFRNVDITLEKTQPCSDHFHSR